MSAVIDLLVLVGVLALTTVRVVPAAQAGIVDRAVSIDRADWARRPGTS